MNFLRFVFSRLFLKHLLIAVAILAVMIWLTLQGLAWFTLHNQYLVVPDFRGMTMQEITGDPGNSPYRFQVTDSVFVPEKTKGSVLSQDPFPGAKVKKDRTIYVTIVSFVPEKTTMPDLKDLTLRQAQTMLQTAGLKLGKLEYIPSFDKDAVQNQFYQGKVIRPGTVLEKGSVISLTLGMGSKDEAYELNDTGGEESIEQ